MLDVYRLCSRRLKEQLVTAGVERDTAAGIVNNMLSADQMHSLRVNKHYAYYAVRKTNSLELVSHTYANERLPRKAMFVVSQILDRWRSTA